MNRALIVTELGAEIPVEQDIPVTLGEVTITLDETSLRIRNGGAPDDWGQGKWVAEPWYFQSIAVHLPEDRFPQLAAINGAVDAGDGWWSLVAPSDFDPPHPRYPKAATTPCLDGGDTFYCRFTRRTDPWEFGRLPTPEQKTHALAVLDLRPDRLEQYPLAARLLGFYTFNQHSANKLCPVVERNFGWHMVPEHFVYKWTSQFTTRVSGWYGAGDIHSPSEGPSNCHYDHDAWALMRYLLTGDPIALAMGLTLVRMKIAYGLVDTNEPRTKCWHRGRWRGEKGQYRRGVLTPGVAANKENDLGLCLASILAPDDPHIARGIAVRRESLLGCNLQDVWNGGGGGRACGHFLENLEAHWRTTGDDAFKVRAEAFINHVFAKNAQLAPNALWLINVNRIGWNAVWEEALWHVYAAKWIVDHGVAPERLDALKAQVEWLLNVGGRDVANGFQVAFEVSTPDGAIKTYNGSLSGGFWSQLKPYAEAWWPGRFGQRIDGALNHTMNAWPANVAVDQTSSTEKFVGILLHAMRR